MDLERELTRRGGVAARGELLRAGAIPRALTAAVSAGTIIRGRRGRYASARLPGPVLAAFRIGGSLAATDAARSYGLWVLRSSTLHVWVPPKASRLDSRAGITLHWDPAWPDDEQLRVSIGHALLQLGRALGVEHLLVALESALEKRLVGADDLARLRDRCPKRLHRALAFARDDAGSGVETLARWRLHLIGVECLTQAWIPGVGRVDLLIGTSLVVEIDGRSTHDFEKDRRRDMFAAVEGYVTLRFSATQVLTLWPEVERAIVTAISRGLHRL